MIRLAKILFPGRHKPQKTGFEILKFLGPGLLITAGFIDPGNWAANVLAGASFGTKLLWTVTLSTLLLILLQHNAAKLGIVTGDCMAESATRILHPFVSRFLLTTAMIASVATAFAEILGGALGLQMLFHIPLRIGAVLTTGFAAWMLFSNSYRKIERWIIGFVSLIGISFIFELALLHVSWPAVVSGWVTPAFPKNSMIIIMSVLGAVVMPHNLFLHSEIIQSRRGLDKDGEGIRKRLKYEGFDTLLSMVVGWAINSAMIILAAAAFFSHGLPVKQLDQADAMLIPLLGNASHIVFAGALIFAGLASSVTAGMAGGSIFSGIFNEPYDIRDTHSKVGVGLVLLLALAVVFFITDPFMGMVYSQVCLSVQLPFSVFLLLALTSSKKVMGKYAASPLERAALWIAAATITALNILLLLNIIRVI
jgi:manganese transport protein